MLSSSSVQEAQDLAAPALDHAPAGYFDARDALRDDAAEAISALRRLGLRVLMLTGDSAEAAAPIARQAGITEVEAGLDPAGKLARIRDLQKMSGETIAALPGPTPVKSGDRTVAILIPLKPVNMARLEGRSA